MEASLLGMRMLISLGEGSRMLLSIKKQMFSLSRNIMLVGMGIGLTATVGFHISVKEPSEDDRVEGFKLSSIEVKFTYYLFRFIFF